MPMNPEVKAKWIAALRSGEYKQTTGCLRDGTGMCCLGVLSDLHARETGNTWRQIRAYEYLGSVSILPDEVMAWACLEDDQGGRVSIGGAQDVSLTNHNDTGRTFPEIADAIESQL